VVQDEKKWRAFHETAVNIAQSFLTSRGITALLRTEFPENNKLFLILDL
jgi:hypothetical protein